MPLVENDDVIEKLSAKAADHAFNIGILPGRGWRRDDVVDTERINPSSNPVTVNAIAVSNQIPRSAIERKRFSELLGGLLGRGVFRYIEVDDPPSLMRQHEENE